MFPGLPDGTVTTLAAETAEHEVKELQVWFDQLEGIDIDAVEEANLTLCKI